MGKQPKGYILIDFRTLDKVLQLTLALARQPDHLPTVTVSPGGGEGRAHLAAKQIQHVHEQSCV